MAPAAFILGRRHAGRMHAGRIEPSSPAAPGLDCLDINLSSRGAAAFLIYGEPPPATLTENELVARPAPPRHSSKPASTLIRYQESWM